MADNPQFLVFLSVRGGEKTNPVYFEHKIQAFFLNGHVIFK